jgi:hypothetical protein
VAVLVEQSDGEVEVAVAVGGPDFGKRWMAGNALAEMVSKAPPMTNSLPPDTWAASASMADVNLIGGPGP